MYALTKHTILFIFDNGSNTNIYAYTFPQISTLRITHTTQNSNASHLTGEKCKNQISKLYTDMDCPYNLSHFIASAPLEGDFYRQIRADVADCDRLGWRIPAEIIDDDKFLNVQAEGSNWRCRIDDFRRQLEAFAPAEMLLDHTSGLTISDDLQSEYKDLETEIEGFCKELTNYKYRISRIIRLPLYMHCLALSGRRPLYEEISTDCIREAHSPDIPFVGVHDQAVDKDTLLKHLTDLRRVDSVIKEWTFTAKIVKSAIAIKTVGWNIDHLKMFEQIERWKSERQISEQMKEMQEALEESTKRKEYFKESLHQVVEHEWDMQQALEEATEQKDKMQKAFEQATEQKEEMQESLKQATKQTQETILQATQQAREIRDLLRQATLPMFPAPLEWLVVKLRTLLS